MNFISQVRRLENHRKNGKRRVVMFNNNKKDHRKKIEKSKKIYPPGPPQSHSGYPHISAQG